MTMILEGKEGKSQVCSLLTQVELTQKYRVLNDLIESWNGLLDGVSTKCITLRSTNDFKMASLTDV